MVFLRQQSHQFFDVGLIVSVNLILAEFLFVHVKYHIFYQEFLDVVFFDDLLSWDQGFDFINEMLFFENFD